jgi:ribosomal protein S18 acetylase RimI-like enzyme
LFSFAEQHIDTPALALRYNLAPWDRPFFPGNTAAISSITVHGQEGAARALENFHAWCTANDVRLVSCRLAQERLVECGFLESQGFRFIELNYRPRRIGLGGFAADPAITIGPATAEDEVEITEIASRIFATGRLHLDPQIGPTIGNRRYAAWAANAFHNAKQSVLTCRMNGRIIGFLVQEKPAPGSRFWSLIGLAPGLAGQGLGRRAWQSLLAYHAAEGVTEVSTSISSHNHAVFNLYVSLGFRFPPPELTLHWCPGGPLASSQT